MNAGLEPIKTHKLDSVRAILSTGSTLAPQAFDFVYEKIKKDVCLSSMSGGTDLIGSFVGGVPVLPVWRGEIQGSTVGMEIQVFDDDGKAIIGEKGELVCTKAFPSMPLGFWGDDDGRRYHEAYFDVYPNVWCHGDYVEQTEHGGFIIYGRSDAVLNPGGVRIGTAEIYRQVEQLEQVEEGLVIGQDWDNDVRVVLFVRLKPGLTLDDDLETLIRKQIRDNATPRHVPAKIIQVADIPRTLSGKIVELAVRNIVHGRPVKNQDALANPEALELFKDLPELSS
jgi:acetoacetyl-CoA synthetase